MNQRPERCPGATVFVRTSSSTIDIRGNPLDGSPGEPLRRENPGKFPEPVDPDGTGSPARPQTPPKRRLRPEKAWKASRRSATPKSGQATSVTTSSA